MLKLASSKIDQSGVAICSTPFGVAGPGRAAGRGRGAAGTERGVADADRGVASVVKAAAGAAIGFIEGMLVGTFAFGLAVRVKSKDRGRGRGNGSETGRAGCVPESIADGVSGKSPCFRGVLPTSSGMACDGSS
jgi:hypothetical protein